MFFENLLLALAGLLFVSGIVTKYTKEVAKKAAFASKPTFTINISTVASAR